MNKDMLPTYARICELYIGQGIQINRIALKLEIDVNHVHRALKLYLNKTETPDFIQIESSLNQDTTYILQQWHRSTTEQISRDINKNRHAVLQIAKMLGIDTKRKHGKGVHERQPAQTCIILNNETGIYYFNEHDVSAAHNIKPRTLNSFFNGDSNAKRHRKFIRMPLN